MNLHEFHCLECMVDNRGIRSDDLVSEIELESGITTSNGSVLELATIEKCSVSADAGVELNIETLIFMK